MLAGSKRGVYQAHQWYSIRNHGILLSFSNSKHILRHYLINKRRKRKPRIRKTLFYNKIWHHSGYDGRF